MSECVRAVKRQRLSDLRKSSRRTGAGAKAAAGGTLSVPGDGIEAPEFIPSLTGSGDRASPNALALIVSCPSEDRTAPRSRYRATHGRIE